MSAAEGTRLRVLAAAGDLIAEQGYGRTTMKAIAAAARVSLQTVNLLGPKARIAGDALAMMFMEDPDAKQLTTSERIAAIMAEPDTDASLEEYFAVLAEANVRSFRLARAVKAGADVDDAIRQRVDEGEISRREDMRRAAAWMLSRGLISAGDVARAADVHALVTSVDTCAHFVLDCGWSTEQYAQWMAEAFSGLVLRRPIASGAESTENVDEQDSEN